MATPVYIVANQRSGTNFLRNVLVSTGLFEDLNEIFQLEEPALYWSFFEEEVKRDPSVAIPTRENRERLFQMFLERHVYSSSAKYVLVDLKYNTTHNMNRQFHPVGDVPFIFEMIKRQDCHLVHLVRENSFETYMSNVLANQTKVYCAFDGDAVGSATVLLDPSTTLVEVRKCQEDINRFRDWLACCRPGNFLEVSYDDLSTLNDSSEFRMAENIKRFFDLSDSLNFEVKTKKIARTPQEVVSNYRSTILPALLSSPFARFAY